MKHFLNLLISLAAALSLFSCSKDVTDIIIGPNDEIEETANPWDDFMWGGTSTYPSHLISPNSDYDGEEICEICYVLNVPKEGGSYSFSLSKEAKHVDGETGTVTDIPNYDFIPWGISEFYYGTENIPQNWYPLLLGFNSKIGSMVNSYDNIGKSASIDTDWYQYHAHAGENTFTITIPENTLKRERQFNLWFEPSFRNGCDSHLSYSLVVMQAK